MEDSNVLFYWSTSNPYLYSKRDALILVSKMNVYDQITLHFIVCFLIKVISFLSKNILLTWEL